MRPAVQRGFTLIEVMIVVAILGVIAAIAFPSYMESVRKSRRADAKSALMAASQAMEKYFTERQTYATATLGSNATDVYPTTSPDGYYTLSFSVASTASAYSLQAAPTAGKGQTSDKCGTFSINQLGAKGVSGGSLNAAACW
ncbi:MAG: type IV pilin protein [Dechloromonas sp.]|uniref:Type IV pilin protein n=1 Tax=Candidatus Dechloromonas phosphorivorans TaxID=2899244 RepID=A0A9D7QGE5_9RHOO|nr:type IV pilin protein [Candidatus Dechloromonas phosphorivorans]